MKTDTLSYFACQWAGDNIMTQLHSDGTHDRLIAKVWLIQLCVSKQIQLADTRVTHLISENTSPHFPETPGFDRLPTSQNRQPNLIALSKNCGYMFDQ